MRTLDVILHRLHRSPWILAASLALVLLLVAGLVVAQQVTQATEPGADLAAAAATSAYDSASSAGLPPDENPPGGSGRSAEALNRIFHYYMVAGTTLRGRSSVTGFAYAASGCTYVTAGTGTNRILNTELLLPNGAEIKYLRVYYRDTNNASGVDGFITRYQPGQGASDLVSAGSSNAFDGGYGFVVSSQITETVNNSRYAYTLIGWPDAADSKNQICGLRVAYYLPTSATYLPTLKK